MNTFRLIITSPDGPFYDGDAYMLSLRGTDGDLAILANHIPFITAVQPGSCKILLPDETEKRGTVDSGILSVSHNTATLLTSSFSW